MCAGRHAPYCLVWGRGSVERTLLHPSHKAVRGLSSSTHAAVRPCFHLDTHNSRVRSNQPAHLSRCPSAAATHVHVLAYDFTPRYNTYDRHGMMDCHNHQEFSQKVGKTSVQQECAYTGNCVPSCQQTCQTVFECVLALAGVWLTSTLKLGCQCLFGLLYPFTRVVLMVSLGVKHMSCF
jgi:hypothetical protein